MTNNKITKWYKIICNSMGFIVLREFNKQVQNYEMFL